MTDYVKMPLKEESFLKAVGQGGLLIICMCIISLFLGIIL